MTILWPFLCLIVTPWADVRVRLPNTQREIREPSEIHRVLAASSALLVEPAWSSTWKAKSHSRHTGHAGHTPYLFHITQWWICFTEAFESEYQEHLCLHICLNETVPSVVLSSLHVKLCPRGSFAILVYAFTEGEAIFDQETIKHVLFDIYI